MSCHHPVRNPFFYFCLPSLRAAAAWARGENPPFCTPCFASAACTRAAASFDIGVDAFSPAFSVPAFPPLDLPDLPPALPIFAQYEHFCQRCESKENICGNSRLHSQTVAHIDAKYRPMRLKCSFLLAPSCYQHCQPLLMMGSDTCVAHRCGKMSSH
jgi:hypothetical protein